MRKIHLEDKGTDGGILGLMLNNLCALGSAASGQGPVTGSRKHGEEPLHYKGWELLDQTLASEGDAAPRIDAVLVPGRRKAATLLIALMLTVQQADGCLSTADAANSPPRCRFGSCPNWL
jgi:hypothetical protein